MYSTASFAPISKPSLKKLMKGRAVRVQHGTGMNLHLSKVQHKKHHSTKMKGKGYNLTFDPYQIQMHHQMMGQGFFDDIGSAFTEHIINPTKQAFQHDVIAPTEHLINSVPATFENFGKQLKRGGTKLGKQVASQLIHKGIPMAASTLGGVAGSAAGALTGNPLGVYAGEAAGSTLGGMAGDQLANYVGKKTGYGLLSHAVKALAPHAKKALIHVGKEVGKHVLSKGLEHAEKMALHHGVSPHVVHESKMVAHHVASGNHLPPEHMVHEVMEGALQHHPHYARVKGMMNEMFGHGMHRMHGGTALIDQPFTVRQAVDTSSHFVKDPMGTFGFGVGEPGMIATLAHNAGIRGFGLKKHKKHKKGGALMAAGY